MPALTSIERIAADTAVLLEKRGLSRDSIRVKNCFGHKQCHNAYCIRCASRRVYHERKHVEESIPKLLAQHPTAQLWFITGATEDSNDVRTHSRAAVRGLRKLLKHPRLVKRVIAHFSALEVSTAHGRSAPCAHIHTLVVVKPIDAGRNRISRKHWIEMWEDACPLARRREPKPKRIRKGPKTKSHPSLHAEQAHVSSVDLVKLSRYVTKWATPYRVSAEYRALLNKPGDAFIERIKALKGVTRFFGELHRKPRRRQSA